MQTEINAKNIVQNILDINGKIIKTNFFSIEDLNAKIIPKKTLKDTKESRWEKSPSYLVIFEDLVILKNGKEIKEEWKLYPKWDVENISKKRGKYKNIKMIEVSNFGRVKINNIIAEQQDKNGQIGYLQLKDYPGLGMVWNLVANTWLEKPNNCNKDIIFHVHHITNNGYDNNVENLIWLDRNTHAKIKH